MDEELKWVKEGLYNNKWNQNVNNYKVFENELCFQNNILLRGSKIVIPFKLQTRLLAAAYEGHPGIVAMISRLRTKAKNRQRCGKLRESMQRLHLSHSPKSSKLHEKAHPINASLDGHSHRFSGPPSKWTLSFRDNRLFQLIQRN